MTNALVKLEGAARMLAEAKSLDEIKHVRDIAEAARQYARAAKMGLDMQNDAAEIKLRAERRAGEVLAVLERGEAGRPEKNEAKLAPISEYRQTLEAETIPIRTARRWQQVSTIPEPTFERVIATTRGNRQELTQAGLLREVQTQRRQEMVEEKRTQPWPADSYQVVYADPPWRYDNSGFDEAAEGQYPTMDVMDICLLPISSLATDSSVLFLWATNPLLPEAMQVLAAWGFSYKTNMAWVKDRGRGKGWFLRSKHELLLIGTRSQTTHPKERPDSCFEAARGPVHSRKPEIAYEIIERMYDGPRLELFARVARPGWTVWGNELGL